MSDAWLAAELVRSPAGVALLESLERAHHRDVRWNDGPVESRPSSVAAAVDAVGTMSFGRLVEHLVSAAERIAGPWRADADRQIIDAFEAAGARTEIAEAVASRFGNQLAAPAAHVDQEWWLAALDVDRVAPAFSGPRRNYCCGEFTWNSVRTVSSPPDEVHDDLVDVWELFPGPISRWRLPVRHDARLVEIHRPEDWVRLVADYPASPSGRHGGRELPRPNQDPRAASQLARRTGGAAARTAVDVVMPDWSRVARDHDGVHLSWAGMATCEGRVIDVPELGSDVVTLVRYWGSERTMWLNDVFGTPTPRPAPALSGRVNGDLGIGGDERRRAADARVIAAVLGRRSVGC